MNNQKIKAHFEKYIVTYMFIALSILFLAISDTRMHDASKELLLRLSRNAFIVLALIIPIIAGMGNNFAITIGAMAAQIGFPLGSLFGFLIGKLLNRMKGQETIGSMILGFFANGAYQLLFLFIFGSLIPLSKRVTIVGASGVQNTLSLKNEVGLYTAIDGILKIPFLITVYVLAGLFIVFLLVQFYRKKITKKRLIVFLSIAVAILVAFLIPGVADIFNKDSDGKDDIIRIPVVTWLLILGLCLFNFMILRTRLGQKFRAVGQSQTVANASGINVNRTRVIAIMISTVLAGWGQILFMQSDGMGTFQTYAAHEQVGLYAGAAILVGGASIDRATNMQALIGTFLFHSLFITCMTAASAIFGDSAVGEYFRAFMSYGVIAVALIMYAWRTAQQKKARQTDLTVAMNAAKQ